jgi:signal transduction histidine kinase/CheY-like chemotaxis protein
MELWSFHRTEVFVRPSPSRFAALLALLLLAPFLSAGQGCILFINSYHYGYGFSDDEMRGFAQAMDAKGPHPEVAFEFLDAKHDPQHLDWPLKARMLAQRYGRDQKPSLVVGSDNDALEFMRQYGSQLFPGAPQVFCGVADWKPKLRQELPRAAFVAKDPEYRETLRTAFRLFPQRRHVLLVSDHTLASQSHLRAMLSQCGNMPGLAGMEVLDLGAASYEQVARRLAQAKPDELAFLLGVSMDGRGRQMDPTQGMRQLAPASAAPVFVVIDSRVCQGALGGRVVSGLSQGRAAADLAGQVLAGAAPGSLPVQGLGANQDLYDAKALARWKLRPADLPEGAVLLNQQPSAWQRWGRPLAWEAGLLLALLSLGLLFFHLRGRHRLADLAERLRQEEELKRSEADLRRSQQVARLGSYHYDPVSGNWAGSQVLDLIFGMQPGDPHDTASWLGVVAEEDKASMQRYLTEEVLGQGRAFNREYRIRRVSDQELRWVHGLGELEFDEQGRVKAMFGTIQDVTERHAIEAERQKLEAKVQQSQKLESLGLLAGGIAHDFNNLLTSILGNADLAKSELSPLTPARQSLEGIETAARRAADLCRQLLAYSGKGRFRIQPLDLRELVEEMGHLLTLSISKKAVLNFHFAQDLPAVEADATQVRQVVMNLILNASEAIADRSGVIAVSTGAAWCDEAYLKGTHAAEDIPAGTYVYLEVSDTGVGMDRETLAKVFDPFFSTKFTGRGLGLAAVLGIMRGHKGAIKIYSEPGKGTSFKLLFPASEHKALGMPGAGGPAPAWKSQGTVLVADDEETIRALARRILERAGFSVLLASDGREAVELFRREHARVRMVLLDLTMPHLDGEACYRELRQIDPTVKVVLSSGYNEQDVVNRFAGKGLAGFVQKPYTADELIAMVRQCLGEA